VLVEQKLTVYYVYETVETTILA